MSDNPQDAVEIISGIESVEDASELARLDAAVTSLLSSAYPERGMGALLRVFERFPDQDGYGVFWSILHGLEGLPGYEEALIESIRRQPSEFSLLMVSRMLNAGRTHVNGTDLLGLLDEVARNPDYSAALHKEAGRLTEWQRRRA